MQIFVAVISLPLLILANSIQIWAYKEYEYCRQFTGLMCSQDASAHMEQVSGVSSQENCANLCSVVYEGHCKYYVYTHHMRLCRMFNSTSGLSHVNDCQKLAGPDFPSITFCQGVDLKCKDSHASDCRYRGTPVEDFPGLVDMEACQMVCAQSRFCQSFEYDQPSGNCTLLDSWKRDCFQVTGSPTSDRNKCPIPVGPDPNHPKGEAIMTSQSSFTKVTLLATLLLILNMQ